MRRIELQSSYILHSRPYRETSLLLEVFTKEHGRISVIAKGIRRHKNPARALLQPFVPLLLSCAGRSELLSLKSFEPEMPMHILTGRRLISGFYLNELIVRLLHRFDPYEELFQNYREALLALESSNDAVQEQITLRLFEKALLKDLGYELPLCFEAETHAPIHPDCYYNFDPEKGAALLPNYSPDIMANKNIGMAKSIYSGKSLLAFAANDLKDPLTQKDAKRLIRQALTAILGEKPLETRRLL